MKREYRTAAAVILVCILTACGQQKEENSGVEPLQIQRMEAEEQGAQEKDEQAEEQGLQEKDGQAEEQSAQETDERAEEQGAQEINGQGAQESQEPSEKNGETEEQQNSEDSIADLYGTWQVTDYKPCRIYAMSQQEIDAFSTCKVSYYEDRFVLEGQNVENFGYTFLNGYTFQGYAWADINQDFQVDLTEWWKGNEVIPMGQISSDEGFFGDIFFRSDEDHIWIYYEGVFFQAEKVGD